MRELRETVAAAKELLFSPASASAGPLGVVVLVCVPSFHHSHMAQERFERFTAWVSDKVYERSHLQTLAPSLILA